MSKTPTSSARPDGMPPGFDDGGMDWAAFDALPSEQVLSAAASDPDAMPSDPAWLATATRVGLAGALRFRLGLSRAEFEARYRIPVALVTAWERGEATPDPAMQAYLAVIADDPDGVARTLAPTQTAAE